MGNGGYITKKGAVQTAQVQEREWWNKLFLTVGLHLARRGKQEIRAKLRSRNLLINGHLDIEVNGSIILRPILENWVFGIRNYERIQWRPLVLTELNFRSPLPETYLVGQIVMHTVNYNWLVSLFTISPLFNRILIEGIEFQWHDGQYASHTVTDEQKTMQLHWLSIYRLRTQQLVLHSTTIQDTRHQHSINQRVKDLQKTLVQRGIAYISRD